MPASSFSSCRPLYARFLLTLVICGGFGIGFLFAGGGTVILPWIQGVQAVIACDNDGSVDAGETCSNCPYDVRCTAAEKCIAGACSSAGWYCKREDVCGDGWISDFEECDDGGICRGSNNASFNGVHCFDLDPAGDRLAGVARCRATGGICVAQDNDGCAKDCQTECHEDGAPCLLASDCCGNACGDGVCGAGGGGGSCGDGTLDAGEECENDGHCSGGTPQCDVLGGCVCVASNGCESCDECPTIIDTWSISVDPLTGTCSGGSDCVDLSGLFTLNQVGAGCAMRDCGYCFAGDLNPDCEAGVNEYRWTLKWDTTGQWVLTSDSSAEPIAYTYVLSTPTFDCDGPNVFNKDSTNECNGWPDTITATPVGSNTVTCPVL